MPNHVYNTITIKAQKSSDLDFFEKYLRREIENSEFEINERNRDAGFSFLALLVPPMTPAEYDEQWYGWNVGNWGTKWDAYETAVERRGNFMNIWFTTAWDVPEPIFARMAELFPELSIHFRSIEEQGWGAEYESEDGFFSMTESWDIPSNHEERMARQGECWECQNNECESQKEEANA